MRDTREPTPIASGGPETRVGVVAIGRNEGERMVTCLRAAFAQLGGGGAVVYVDSGSSDGSPSRARSLGAAVIDLDLSTPFTAARARNAGLAELRHRRPEVEFVQFLDADCEMLPGWIETAADALLTDPSLAGVAGVLRERHADATVYNRLCDMEWQSPAGETRAIGGNAMLRVAALAQVGGYDSTLIAGEEPEMCVRLRDRGWRLWRLEQPMALHDAAMTRFGQWWKRAIRFGYAQTQVSRMHRRSPHRIWAKESRSTLAWALGPPTLTLMTTLALASAVGGWSWLLGLAPMGLYGLLALKIFLARRRDGASHAEAALYSAAATLAKFPQFAGMLRYFRHRLSGRASTIIEYRTAATSPLMRSASQ